ncbi:MAG: Gfo/Idh/MocA family oxidoreductase [Tepidisphaeraceae bacterium]
MPRQWRIAVVGTGVVGELHVRSMMKLPNCRLVSVCDLERDQGRKALDKNKLSVPIYTDLEEMLRKEKLDSVHVCTPSGDHKGPVITAMEHGLNVLVEKPMEIEPKRIDEMIAVAKQKGVKLAGIFQNRWNDANRALRQAVQDGRFGKIAWAGVFTPWYRTDQYYEEGGWRGTWKLDGGGAVMNQGVHQVDLMQWIVGPVKTVSAYASSRIHPKIEVEDTLTCALQFENGAHGTYVSTTAMWPGGAVRIEIGGELGTAISENGLKRFEFKNPQPGDMELLDRLNPANATNSGGGKAATDIGLDLHGKNMLAVYEAWERGEEAETCGPEARKAVAIIQAMYESARRNGSPVDVK